MNLLFCGTPLFAQEILEALTLSFPDAHFHVLTAPDRKRGRGMQLSASPVKEFALAHGITCSSPETLRDAAALPLLETFLPDIAVVAAYGKILPPYFLQFPRLGCLNVHASLLPRWRGAAPIERAILSGDKTTGVTIMQMNEGLDTGDILLQESCAIDDTDTAQTLTEKLAKIGAGLIVKAVQSAQNGTLNPRVQDDTLACYAEKLRREDEALDFSQSAALVHAKIRALSPSPAARALLDDGTELKLVQALPTKLSAKGIHPGTIRVSGKQVLVACGDYFLSLISVKPQGKGAMDAFALVNGRKLSDGSVLS